MPAGRTVSTKITMISATVSFSPLPMIYTPVAFSIWLPAKATMDLNKDRFLNEEEFKKAAEAEQAKIRAVVQTMMPAQQPRPAPAQPRPAQPAAPAAPQGLAPGLPQGQR